MKERTRIQISTETALISTELKSTSWLKLPSTFILCHSEGVKGTGRSPTAMVSEGSVTYQLGNLEPITQTPGFSFFSCKTKAKQGLIKEVTTHLSRL